MAKKKDTSIDDLADAINALATTMEKRFDGVDKRFDGVDKRFDGVDKRFDGVDKRFESIDKRFDRQDIEIKEIKNQLFTMTSEQRETREAIERLENKYGGLNADIAEIYDRIVALEKRLSKDTNNLENDLEIQALRSKIQTLSAWAREVSRKTGVARPKL